VKTSMASTARSFLLRLALAAGMVFISALLVRAGGPKSVAGTAYFDPTTTGKPLVWPQGTLSYYTDQGDLSPILPNVAANTFVASAFSVWTSVPTAALSLNSPGSLAEDVNGTNVTVNSDGTISMPPDIQPTATGTPIAVVYDADGTVTDALLGSGAGGSGQCFFNAVIGGTDNYGPLAAYQHALIVINGQCVQQSSQLTDVEYRLVRMIGSVLGVGWSQVNVNVLTGSPSATSDDYLGFPLMHALDSLSCTPITFCYPNPYQLSIDDVAAISRLYPVTAQNQSSFPGKQVFSATTARIHGSAWFTDTHGTRTQPMQGVNVVARWIDPNTGVPSRRYVASSVSGFLFSGNEGNPITGLDDAVGDPLAEWGSDDPALEGFFDLSGLQLPNGGTARYQLSVEPLDPRWSPGVGSYSPGPVAPSGIFQPITVTVSAGGDVQQDVLMNGAAQPMPAAASTWTVPAALPSGGDWVASLSGYGDVDYFLLPVQANRTLSVAVTALDDSGHTTEGKAQPVIGIWAATDPEGTTAPAFTPSPFNSVVFATTRLDAQILASNNFLIGISDVRGDGRPDYRYHARALYGDSVSPARLGVNGGAITVQGTGLAPGLSATVAGTNATPLAVSAGSLTLAASAHRDGPQNIIITDPLSGASTSMTGALMYGAAPSDNIVLLYTGNPSTPVGTQAAKPLTARVLMADGVTPVSGATIGWSASNSLQLSACGGASSCSVVSDQSGMSTTWLTPAAVGIATVTATLAPGIYTPSKSVNATLNATQSASDIGVSAPYLWISQGATVTLPLTARALSNGVPRGSVQVNFTIVSGSGSLSAASAQTNSSGYATVNLSLTQMKGLVQISACVAPGNAPCGVFYANAVPLAQQYLQAVAGAGQVSTSQNLQAVVVRVIDSSSPPNSIIAAPVVFQTTVLRGGGTSSAGGNGETNPGNPAMPVILQASQNSAATDVNGLASIVPSGGGFSPPLEVDVRVIAGSAAFLDYPLELLPALVKGSNSATTIAPVVIPSPVRLVRAFGAENR
jgi:IPT/TIG domain-containing protein